MSEMSKCSQSCTCTVCLAALIPLGQLSYLLAAPALPCLAAMLLSAPRGGAGIRNLLMDAHHPVQAGDRFLCVDTGVTEDQQQDAR